MKKKEITLQDIFDKLNDLNTNFVNSITELEHKLSSCNQVNEQVTEKHSEPEIPNTAYVILTEDGCFVGGEPTTQYNGEDIYRPHLCVAYFKEARDIIREEYGYELLELHCLQSSTEGEFAETGNPVPDKDGTYAWVRAVYKNKEDKVLSSLWAFAYDYGSASNCASFCTGYCGNSVQGGAALRAGLFGSVA